MKNKKPIFPSLVTLESGLEIMKGGYKMKQSRRVLAVLIALVMVMTMIPQNALAAKNKSKKKKCTIEISYVYSNGKKAAKTVKKSYPAGKKKVKATVNVPKKKGYTATMTKKETKKAKKLFTKFQFNGKKIKYQLNQAKKNIKIQVVYVKNKTEKTTKKKEETKPADSDKDDADEGTTAAPAEEGTTAAPAEEGTTAAPAEEGTTAAPAEEGTTVAPADATTTQAKQDTEPAEGFKKSGKLTKTMGNSMSVDVDIPEGAFDVPVRLELNEVSDDDKAKIEEYVGDYVDMALVDISFLDEDGNELEPKEGNNIDVSIKTDNLNEADIYTLYHINSNGDVEEVTPPDFEEPEVSDKVTMFSSDQFSVYAIVASTPTNNEQYVIYTGTTALAYNGNNLTTAAVTVENDQIVRSDSDNIVWTFTQTGTSGSNTTYRISYTNNNQTRYLRNDRGDLRTSRTASEWVYDSYNHRLSQGNRYLRFDNGSFSMSSDNSTSQAATVYLAHVESEPPAGDLTYYYYNADVSASISGSEVAPSLTNTWTDVANLAKEIPGYQYLEARANDKNGDIITQVNGRAYRTGTETSGNGHELNSIYFVYMKDYVAHEDVIPGLNGPDTDKTVTKNSDGTYTIQLDITGVTNEVKHGANVVVVFDRTSSMSGNMSTSDRTMRINAAISAVNTMVTTLNPGTGTDQNDIDFALVEFDRNAAVYDFGASGIAGHTGWTKSGSALTTRVGRYQNGANLAASGATPGGGGTNWQAALRETAAVLESKPDADPTYVVFMTDGEPTIYIGSDSVLNNRSVNDPEYYKAVPYANAIVAADYEMYDIFCSASDTTLLESLYNTSGAASYVEAETQEAIENAFEDVAEAMLEAIGSSNVSSEDGVPDLGSFDIDTVDGVAKLSEARYYKNGALWDDAPEATPSAAGVKWDLSQVGTLENGTHYTIEFEIWPSQEALDLIADLNNGLRSYEPGHDNSISDAERAQVDKVSEGVYTLKTNTSLQTSYKLYGVNHTDDIDFTGKAMDLPTKTISIKKLWPENMLDEYGEAVYRDDDGVEHTASEIKLTLMRENDEYLDVIVDKNHDWKRDDIYVSCGFMTMHDLDGDGTIDESEVEIKEHGHDYQIVEPIGFSYYWDLISDIYHPMVINGTDTLLVLDLNATSADYINTFKIDGKYYSKSDNTESTLEGSNYRRSTLNLTKKLSIASDNSDDYFTYTVKVKDAFSTDGKVWFSAWDPDKEYVDPETGETKYGAIVTEPDWVISGASAQEGDTGYWHAENGATIQFKIKAGWNVRFLNLYHGSTFEFEETYMPDSYEFVSAEASTAYEFMNAALNGHWYDIDTNNKKLVTGTITEPNNHYTVTYTNKITGYFYVYHSSDNTIEKISIEDPRVKVKNKKLQFNIVNETKSGNLYGGYYKKYDGAKASKEQINETAEDSLIYTEKSGTTPTSYNGNHTGGYWADDLAGATKYGRDPAATIGVWDGSEAYIPSGLTMEPKVKGVYYLKEVPDKYLRMTHFEVCNWYSVHRNSDLYGLYMLTAIDDDNYWRVGFKNYESDGESLISDYKDPEKSITGNWTDSDTTAGIYDQVKVKYKGASDPDSVEYRSTIDIDQISGMSGTEAPDNGHIAMAQHALDVSRYTTAKGQVDGLRAYFVTPDKVKVYGNRLKQFTLKDVYGYDEDGNQTNEPDRKIQSSTAPTASVAAEPAANPPLQSEISYKLFGMTPFVESDE